MIMMVMMMMMMMMMMNNDDDSGVARGQVEWPLRNDEKVGVQEMLKSAIKSMHLFIR